MSGTFQAFRMNHVYLVINNQTKQPAGEPLATMESAEAEAARLNLKLWRDAKPEGLDTVSFDEIGDPWESLSGILDRMHYAQELERAA